MRSTCNFSCSIALFLLFFDSRIGYPHNLAAQQYEINIDRCIIEKFVTFLKSIKVDSLKFTQNARLFSAVDINLNKRSAASRSRQLSGSVISRISISSVVVR